MVSIFACSLVVEVLCAGLQLDSDELLWVTPPPPVGAVTGSRPRRPSSRWCARRRRTATAPSRRSPTARRPSTRWRGLRNRTTRSRARGGVGWRGRRTRRRRRRTRVPRGDGGAGSATPTDSRRTSASRHRGGTLIRTLISQLWPAALWWAKGEAMGQLAEHLVGRDEELRCFDHVLAGI